MVFIGKTGDPMESDGERLPDLGEVPVRSDFPEAFGQIRVSLSGVDGWAVGRTSRPRGRNRRVQAAFFEGSLLTLAPAGRRPLTKLLLTFRGLRGSRSFSY